MTWEPEEPMAHVAARRERKRLAALWGLWRSYPGEEGWCMFQTGTNPDHVGWGWNGTKAEAEKGRKGFVREGRPAKEYVVVPFDRQKEPKASGKAPSPAQLEALAYVRKTGTVNRFPRPKGWSQIVDALHRHGWLVGNFDEMCLWDSRRPLRLTATGWKALGEEKPSEVEGIIVDGSGFPVMGSRKLRREMGFK